MTDPLVRSRLDGAALDAYVGPYRLVRQLGEGGMGVVHLAVAPNSQRVALRQLRPHVVGDAEVRHRLAREIAAMRRVEHPRVAPCLDGDAWGSVPYVITRFVAGSNLAEHVLDAGRWPVRTCTRWRSDSPRRWLPYTASGCCTETSSRPTC